MTSYTRHLSGKKFETRVGEHLVITDQPIAGGGTDAGPTPPELLLAALGSCAGHYAVEYLQTRSLSAQDLEIRVSAAKDTSPARLASFLIEVNVPGIDERHQQGLFRAVKTCLIHNTLLAGPTLEVVVTAAQTLSV
jgi:putative redox protein